MSYTAAIRPPSLGATSDKTPTSSSVDFIQTWNRMKDAMIQKLGRYEFKDGSPVTADGPPQPMVTMQICVVIHDWLVKVAGKMIAQAGSNSSSMKSALASYQSSYNAWKALATFTNTLQERLTFPQANQFMQATTNFCSAMSTGQWVAYNLETSLERLRKSLDETPGGSVITGFFDSATTALGVLGLVLGNLGTVTKLAIVGGVGLVGYKLYDTFIRKE